MKIVFIHILFFLLFSFSFFQCKKDKAHGPIQGQVIDATSGNEIPSATVFVRKTNCDCFMCGPEIIATIQCDAKGKFTYLLEKEKGYSYDAVALGTNYFNSSASADEVAVDYGETVSIKLQPKAWLKVSIKNIQPFDGNDHIGISGLGGSPIQLFGTDVDTFFIGTVYGNQNNLLYWSVIKNNGSTSYSGSFYCTAFDTTGFSIDY